MTAFIPAERRSQASFFARDCADSSGYQGSPYRLTPDRFHENLAPDIREAALDYFGRLYGITWHIHANHGLSSQVCCLNFLMPLATRPETLSRLVGHALGIEPPEMLPVEEGAFGVPWYVGFEWIGERDYLNEAPTGRRTRGANVTSTDAIVRFRHEGRIETLLIEWKYSESYGAPLKPGGNPTRVKRYAGLAFASDGGPIRTDLGLELENFFWEPFYQLLRQQMLASRMQQAAEGGAERVRVLHISPAGNRALHKVTPPALRQFGTDAFEVFGNLLVDDGAFVARSTEEVFGGLLAQAGDDPWATYLLGRYGFLNDQSLAQAGAVA